MIQIAGKTREAAIAAWNRRALTPKEDEAVVERVADAIGRVRARHIAADPESYVRKYRSDNIELARAALAAMGE